MKFTSKRHEGISLVCLTSLGHSRGKRVTCGRARLISLVPLAMEVGAHGLCVGMLRQQETEALQFTIHTHIMGFHFLNWGQKKCMYQISSHPDIPVYLIVITN